jgi:uncharacterized protein (DUF1697 family)
MTRYAALLRAVNVGGTGKLPMAELRDLAKKAAFSEVQTYLASGNLVLTSPRSAAQVKATLEAALAKKLGKASAVFVRTETELGKTVDANPFSGAEPARVLVWFLEDAPAKSALSTIKAPGGERFALIGRELFVHFENGMGKSKFKAPFAEVGTARNLNTVRALLDLLQSPGPAP